MEHPVHQTKTTAAAGPDQAVVCGGPETAAGQAAWRSHFWHPVATPRPAAGPRAKCVICGLELEGGAASLVLAWFGVTPTATWSRGEPPGS